MDLLDELQHRTVLGDGALGTLLIERGASLGSCLEELCLSAPDLIAQAHADYIAAGARVIGTNTFGGNSVRLEAHGFSHRTNEINWSAAQLARDAAKGHDVTVAGAVGPLGITAAQASERGIDRAEVFTEQIGALLDGGAQAISFETFFDLDELLIALEAKQSLHHCPAICSFACCADGHLPDGTALAEAFARLRAAGAEIVGINCVGGPAVAVQLFEELTIDPPMAAFPSAGTPGPRGNYFTTPAEFTAAGLQLAARGVRLIGGCCGIGPSHIAALAEALAALPRND